MYRTRMAHTTIRLGNIPAATRNATHTSHTFVIPVDDIRYDAQCQEHRGLHDIMQRCVVTPCQIYVRSVGFGFVWSFPAVTRRRST